MKSWKQRLVSRSAGLSLGVLLVGISPGAGKAVILPIEVVPAARLGAVKSLWMQIHGLEYADMVSIQINSSAWVSLNNESVVVAEPARSYGGIGGGFATLKLTLALPPRTVVGGANTIRFRFNHSDGVVSGFRVLALNFVTRDGQTICPSSAFMQENPDAWVAPRLDSESVATGQTLWKSAPLTASSLPHSQRIQAHCADCHARDGRDLKYFNFSNPSIIARARFHGLSLFEGQQIASYIRSLPFPHPGRPWNPPYQPGPGLDAQPVNHWAAGAGLEWVLDHDEDTLGFIFAQRNQTLQITPATFRPDGNLNAREIPISLQLPDWNHWLPRVHPLDAWGSDFLDSDFCQMYHSSPVAIKLSTSGEMTRFFETWSLQRARLLKKPLATQCAQASQELTVKIYSTQLWQLVKTWEWTQEFGLEARGESRAWLNTIPQEAAPAAAKIPDSPNGMGGSALVNEYFDNSWYELQLLLNNGNHRHQNNRPIDWVYFMGRFLDLQRESHRPEPGRVLVSVIKAMQSTDPRIGPEDEAQGWRPNRSVEPSIMVNPSWARVFEPLPSAIKKAITESLLEAWLDKNAQYPLAHYFAAGRSQRSYKAPLDLGAISNGKVWEASLQFHQAQISPQLIRRLMDWGHDYTDAAARFSY
jgi:hypothetical protein